MATTELDDLPSKDVRFATVRDMAGRTWEEAVEVTENVSTTVHGRAGRPLWPVLLCVVTILAFVIGGATATAVGVVAASLLLAYTVGRK